MDSNTQYITGNKLPAEYPADETMCSGNGAALPAARSPHRRLAFWKVTAIGLCVGMTAGAALGFAAMEPLLALLGLEATAASQAAVYGAVMASLGLFGAGLCAGWSATRQTGDKVEFSSMIDQADAPPLDKSPAPAEYRKYHDKATGFAFHTIVYSDDGEGPMVDTYDRDQGLSTARQALLSMDHTKVISH